MKHFLFFFLSLFLFLSCTDEHEDICFDANGGDDTIQSTKLNLSQALAYASKFNMGMQMNDLPESSTRSSASFSKVISNVDFYIENGDTLLYAVNYMNDGGYVLIAGDNSAFPILSHSNIGNLYFSTIPAESPMSSFVVAAKNKVKDKINNPSSKESEYFDRWKDFGKDGCEYEIEICDDEPVPQTRGRRDYSTGKKKIYPYTGKDLDYWCQKGGYNLCAKNLACIGCPAISIGMLLYDTSERMNGNVTQTYPRFDSSDKRDISSEKVITETARKLRQVADYIPNYKWGRKKDMESGADADDILSGLKKVGFKNATYMPYDFETLYKNLSFKGTGYMGMELTFYRGVLIAAWDNYDRGGHIWFCDGYYEQSYKVTRKKGKKVTTWTEYDDRLYMNWGWGHDGGNGWFSVDDGSWFSVDGKNNVQLKNNPIMFVNLFDYVRN